jgi:chromate transporter
MPSTPTRATAPAAAAASAPPRLSVLAAVFGKIGLLSFGPGTTTLLLMEQELVRRRGWLTARQFAFALALSRSYPGVHLLAQAVVIGYLLRGLSGALVSLAGLLLPASAVTLALTIGFVGLRTHPLAGAAIDGLLPATAGMTLALGGQLLRTELATARGGARWLDLALALLAFGLVAWFGVSSALVVLGAGLAGAVLYRLVGRQGPTDEPSGRER